METTLNNWVSLSQWGFLKGRSMISNVLDIELSSRVMGSPHAQASMILFDFNTAFPSISYAFVWRVLAHFRIHPSLLATLRAFYVGNRQKVCVRSHHSSGFVAECGVRQGCPISPLLFAVIMDTISSFVALRSSMPASCCARLLTTLA